MQDEIDSWNEARYLAQNPDVHQAVHRGEFQSGYQHYLQYGQFEGRPGVSVPRVVDPEDGQWTRLCLDPWNLAEFEHDGAIKPCCNHPALENLESEAPFRESDGFRALRHQLLTGDLGSQCAKCHIRKRVSLDEQANAVKALVGEYADPLSAGRLDRVRIDVTTECNLRCVYCPVSLDTYHGQHMSSENMARILTLLQQFDRLSEVAVNGHGETTYHPHWQDFCAPLLDKGYPLSLISNLARAYGEQEFQLLSRFEVIQVSFDTADPALLKKLRRKVSLDRIVYNLSKIRAAAIADARTPPKFSVSCGIYDKNVFRLREFAAFAIAIGVDNVTFWNLVKKFDLPDAENVQNLATLPAAEQHNALEECDAAISLLRLNSISVSVAGDFLNEMRAALAAQNTAQASDLERSAS